MSSNRDLEILKAFAIGEGMTIQEQTPEEDGYSKNNAWCAGRDIYLSDFDNVEHKILALAHEIGHTTNHKAIVLRYIEASDKDAPIGNSTMVSEAIAWEAGLTLLDGLGIKVRDSSLDYIGQSLSTYDQYKG